MIAYAESSAVLAWILNEPGDQDIRKLLAGSDRVVSSSLTLLECHRALARARTLRRITRSEETIAGRLLDAAARSWVTLDMAGAVLEVARAGFPDEPVRTLDALHLATAVLFNEASNITMVSLDDRIRRNAIALGMNIAP